VPVLLAVIRILGRFIIVVSLDFEGVPHKAVPCAGRRWWLRLGAAGLRTGPSPAPGLAVPGWGVLYCLRLVSIRVRRRVRPRCREDGRLRP
jgi:hypothetical protein